MIAILLLDVDHFKAYNDRYGHQAGDRALRNERNSRGALQLADEALYQAKTRGRKRVEVLDFNADAALQTGVFTKGTDLRR